MHSVIPCRTLAVMVAGLAMTNEAQTNAPAEYARWFVLPEPHLRTEAAYPSVSPSVSPSNLPVATVKPGHLPAEARPSGFKVLHPNPDVMALNHGDAGLSAWYSRRFDQDFIPLPEPSKNPVSRALDSIFIPEEFRVGKTAVSCSILTAIKRKNPFCLLNPIVLNVSW